MKRVIAYIDGHNLYYGLRGKYGRKYHWLDLQALASSLLPPAHDLIRVDYFTARIRNQPISEQRQDDYISAMGGFCPRLRIIEGRFQQRIAICRSCGAGRSTYDEKETDVNIARRSCGTRRSTCSTRRCSYRPTETSFRPSAPRGN